MADRVYGENESEQGTTKEAAVVDFSRDVAPLLDRRCGGCHVGERAKAGFEIDDRDAVLGYLTPGDPEDSLLWSDYFNAASALHDPSTTVMPLSGPLPDSELAIVHQWIETGAEWPEEFKFISTARVPDLPLASSPIPTTLSGRIVGFLGYFHPAVVHFPIALLVFGGASAALSFFTGGRAIYVAFYSLLWGTLFAIVATVLGWCLAIEKGYPAWTSIPNAESLEAASTVFRHRWLGTATTILSIVTLGFAILAMRHPKSAWRHVWRLVFVAVAILISIVGHQGGELVYGDILHRAFDRLLGK